MEIVSEEFKDSEPSITIAKRHTELKSQPKKPKTRLEQTLNNLLDTQSFRLGFVVFYQPVS